MAIGDTRTYEVANLAQGNIKVTVVEEEIGSRLEPTPTGQTLTPFYTVKEFSQVTTPVQTGSFRMTANFDRGRIEVTEPDVGENKTSRRVMTPTERTFYGEVTGYSSTLF